MIRVHSRENNAESQQHLDKNRKRFSRKCRELLVRLYAGERLTVLSAANTGISSLPRRILDLKESGVLISDKWENGVKVWFMTEEQKFFNQKQFDETNILL